MKCKTLAVIFLTLTTLLLASCDHEAVVMTVGDLPVTPEEYAITAYDQIALTAGYFFSEYDADVNDKDFWETEYDEQTPTDYLKAKTDAVIVENFGIQNLALELGLITEPSWKDFLVNFELENEYRQQMLDNGEVIYGPKQYTIAQYHSYYIAAIEQVVEDHIRTNIILPTEEDLKTYYPILEEKEGEKNFTGELGFYMWNGDTSNDVMGKEIAQQRKEYPPEKVAERLGIEYHTASVNTLELGKENQVYEDIIGAIALVEVGQLSETMLVQTKNTMIEVLDKDYVKFGSFEETKDIVSYEYCVLKTKEYIQSAMSNTEIVKHNTHKAVTIDEIKSLATEILH